MKLVGLHIHLDLPEEAGRMPENWCERDSGVKGVARDGNWEVGSRRRDGSEG